MKRNLCSKCVATNTLAAILACMTLLIISPSFGRGAIQKTLPEMNGDSIFIQKQITSKKHKISLYPNADQQVLFFGVNGAEGKVYQLFLFDVDGRLVKQSEIRNKQTTLIRNIEKGTYLFDVFSDDERIENGQIIVR